MTHILLVEDEPSIREAERLYLEQAGWAVTEATTGDEALIAWEKERPDLVVLDLNLPGQDGLSVCKTIRTQSLIPIIMVTARVEEVDELVGLDVGADDYLRKPFSPAVLVARVRVLLRRTGNEVLRFKDIQIDPSQQTVIVKGTEHPLSTTRFRILHALAQSPGKILTRADIMESAYGPDGAAEIFDRTIDAHIRAIRQIIEDDSRQPRYVHTVIGSGYKFTP
jgi:DNA-binding response OmpR family regulator